MSLNTNALWSASGPLWLGRLTFGRRLWVMSPSRISSECNCGLPSLLELQWLCEYKVTWFWNGDRWRNDSFLSSGYFSVRLVHWVDTCHCNWMAKSGARAEVGMSRQEGEAISGVVTLDCETNCCFSWGNINKFLPLLGHFLQKPTFSRDVLVLVGVCIYVCMRMYDLLALLWVETSSF